LFTTTTFVSVTLPVLLTEPEKTSNCPGETGCTGQDFVTRMPGVVALPQVMLLVLFTERGAEVN
jgi:hypothetical protein